MKIHIQKIKQSLIIGILSFGASQISAQCPIPSLVTASPATLCAGATTSLNATAAGAAINWYTVPTGGTPIGSSLSGANYSVIPVNTTTYYAESFVAGTQTLNYTGSLQTYTVPVGVTQMTISARGAEGGSVSVTCSATAGKGADMSGVFAVTPGQVLSILVGGQGLTNGSDGGGGGGSYVVLTPANTPWLIAGGGGGASNNIASCGPNRNGIDAVITNNGTASGTGMVAGGAGGNGGGANVGSGGGGAGWLSNGTPGSGNVNCAGKSYLNGGAGGSGFNNDSGGYGGGGAGWYTGGNGGGGGGYSGGGTDGNYPSVSFLGGGGGGSYNIGTGQVNTAGIGTGNGRVIISYATCVSVSRTPVTVTVNAIPTITVNSGSICTLQSFTMIPGGANTYTFQGGNAVVSPTANASYTVIGTSTAGCTSILAATSNVTVNANPTITVNSGSICSGGSFTMVPGGANTYTFQGGNAIVSPTTTTSYTIVGTSTAGCVSNTFATSNVTVNTTPTVGITGNTLICGTGTNVLTCTGADTYSWSTGVISPTIIESPTVTTNYTVIGTNTLGGCNNTFTISILVSTNPTVSITGGTVAVCVGSTVNLTAGGATTYSWNNGTITSTIATTPTVNTTYSVVGTNTDGCIGNAVVIVTVNALPSVSIAASGTICIHEAIILTASGADTYSWNTGAITNTITDSPLITTTYTAIGTSSLTGCTNTISATVVVSPCTGINTVSAKINGLSIYPNPSSGVFTVELNNGLNKTIEVTDLSGRIVLSNSSLQDKVNVNINHLSNGIYYLKIQSNNTVEVVKVIKQ